ncbi:hypothetical protein ACOYW6_10030 [Parablastomonas sp. CN1-191]|uniref:hypothetical protein n=1 Tax=Parablastomonas sp. CN1-191 TaxID=3400908 RepID=UPI003BF81507
MTSIRRVIAVVLAYVAAALAVGAAFVAWGVASDADGWTFGEIGSGIPLSGLMAAIYALPVAVPIILLTELSRAGHWFQFLLAGIALGVLLTLALTEVPYRGLDMELASMLMSLSLLGSMAYWLFAWRLLGTRKSAFALESTTS